MAMTDQISRRPLGTSSTEANACAPALALLEFARGGEATCAACLDIGKILGSQGRTQEAEACHEEARDGLRA
jgi:hypothetical protein